jgi:sugar lactone lactonase YvrE
VTSIGVTSDGSSSGPGVFDGPWGIAIGPDGHLYISDTSTGTPFMRVQAFTGDGTYVGQWSEHATGLACDAFGNVYAAEPSSIRKTTSAGAQLGLWGSAGGGPGQLDLPMGLALDAAGNVYVADTWNHRVQVFAPDGSFLTQWGSYGSAPGQFYRPMGIAVGADGRVYVADTYNNRIQVFGSLPTPTKTSSWGKLKAAYR